MNDGDTVWLVRHKQKPVQVKIAKIYPNSVFVRNVHGDQHAYGVRLVDLKPLSDLGWTSAP